MNFHLKVSVPANTTAIVHLPAFDDDVVSEGRQLLSNLNSVKVLGFENRKLKIEIGSGDYHFTVTTRVKRSSKP